MKRHFLGNLHVMHNKRFHFLLLSFTFSQSFISDKLHFKDFRFFFVLFTSFPKISRGFLDKCFLLVIEIGIKEF